MIIYLAIILSKKYRFIQLNIFRIISSLKSNSKNDITPFGSLCLSLASKIGVGSLSGIALAIYYGGVGTIFWLVIISLLVSINSHFECILGIKYREKIGHIFYGGPSYYIKKCLGLKWLGIIYAILVILCYSLVNLSIQANTIIKVICSFNVKSIYGVIVLLLVVFLIIMKGLKMISGVNKKIVPIMLILYLLLGLYVVVKNYNMIPNIFINVFREAFKLRSIIPVFLMGMQRAIFITESSTGTSAISASICDNVGEKQGLIEVFGIYIIIFLVCLTTFILIVTSNYQMFNYNNTNGIEILMHVFYYHFGSFGEIVLSVIVILFAFSTVISSYFFGENNILAITKKRELMIVFRILFIFVITCSYYVRASILWGMADMLIGVLSIINVYAMIKINDKV